MTDITPPSLRVVPNLRHENMTLEQLREEVDCWELKLEGAGQSTAHDYFTALTSARRWLETREKQAEASGTEANDAPVAPKVDYDLKIDGAKFEFKGGDVGTLVMAVLPEDTYTSEGPLLFRNGRLVQEEIVYTNGRPVERNFVDVTDKVAQALMKAMFPASTVKNTNVTNEIVPL